MSVAGMIGAAFVTVISPQISLFKILTYIHAHRDLTDNQLNARKLCLNQLNARKYSLNQLNARK